MSRPTCPAWCEESSDPLHWSPFGARGGNGRALPQEAGHVRGFGRGVTVFAGEAVYPGGEREAYPPVLEVKHERVEMEGASLYELEAAVTFAAAVEEAVCFMRNLGGRA